MTRFEFCTNYIYLKGRPIDFSGRPYLRQIYYCSARRIVLRAGRQVEKSTLLANFIIHQAVTRPGVEILFAAPRDQQSHVFTKMRLMSAVRNSPVIARVLLGRRPSKLRIKEVEFVNGSTLYVRSAFHKADASRGLTQVKEF
jgi:hypothetical protein